MLLAARDGKRHRARAKRQRDFLRRRLGCVFRRRRRSLMLLLLLLLRFQVRRHKRRPRVVIVLIVRDRPVGCLLRHR